ncbi:hypothetical protein CSUI_000553, partial [Cystoisospora suis]
HYRDPPLTVAASWSFRLSVAPDDVVSAADTSVSRGGVSVDCRACIPLVPLEC